MMKKLIFLLWAISLAGAAFGQRPAKLRPIENRSLAVPEPSDICPNPNNPDHFFVVSDNGLLFEITAGGQIVRQADFKGYDWEGVHADDKFVYVVDEMTRKIHVLDIENLEHQKTYTILHSGGRNKGFESITFNPVRNTFVMVVEKEPVLLVEFNESFKRVNEVHLTGMRDISAATFYNGSLWLLSDEDMTVFRLDPNTYKTLNSWRIPVINPEGMAFDKSGNMIIISDDMERKYVFPNPLTNNEQP